MSTSSLVERIPDLPPLKELVRTPEGVPVTGFRLLGEADALPWWRRLRDLHPKTGLWPVIMDEFQPTNLAAQYTDADVLAWLRKPDPRDEATIRADLFSGRDSPNPKGRANWLRGGKWPKQRESIRYSVFTDWKGVPKPIVLGLVPADGGWAVPGVLHFSAGNACPTPKEHVAALRHWHERYGADLVVMTSATLEFAVARPPATQDEARALARELGDYSEGPFESRTVTELAAALLDSPIWLAWWD